MDQKYNFPPFPIGFTAWWPSNLVNLLGTMEVMAKLVGTWQGQKTQEFLILPRLKELVLSGNLILRVLLLSAHTLNTFLTCEILTVSLFPNLEIFLWSSLRFTSLE